MKRQEGNEISKTIDSTAVAKKPKEARTDQSPVSHLRAVRQRVSKGPWSWEPICKENLSMDDSQCRHV